MNITHRTAPLIAATLAALASGCGSGDFDADDAAARADEFVETFNSHDAEATLELVADEAVVTDNFGVRQPDDWTRLLIWNVAQETALVDVACTATSNGGHSFEVNCETGTLDAPARAVGADPVPTDIGFVIDGGLINEIHYTYGDPDFNHVGRPFEAWLRAHRPDRVDEAGCCGGNTGEEALSHGTTRRELAREWAQYLEAEGCAWHDRCY